MGLAPGGPWCHLRRSVGHNPQCRCPSSLWRLTVCNSVDVYGEQRAPIVGPTVVNTKPSQWGWTPPWGVHPQPLCLHVIFLISTTVSVEEETQVWFFVFLTTIWLLNIITVILMSANWLLWNHNVKLNVSIYWSIYVSINVYIAGYGNE